MQLGESVYRAQQAILMSASWQIPKPQGPAVWKYFIKHPHIVQTYTHVATHVHMPLCRYERQCQGLTQQARGASFQDVLRDSAEVPQWVLKQRVNKEPLTAQPH